MDSAHALPCFVEAEVGELDFRGRDVAPDDLCPQDASNRRIDDHASAEADNEAHRPEHPECSHVILSFLRQD